MLKIALRVTLGLVLVAILAFGIFCYSVIQEIPLEVLSEVTPPVSMAKEQTDFIEEGTQIKKSDLKLYWTWNESDIGLKSELREKQENGQAVVTGEIIEATENINLPMLRSNNCDQVYCLQHRLRFHQIPSVLWKGLIGIEDYRFLEHKGVDPKSLLRALWHDIKVLKLEQGGSTLTQQLVKNLFYTNEKKFSRKFKEMIVSTYLEFKLEKEQILAMYFNEVLWGSFQGIKLKGVYAASVGYFEKKPSQLDPFEASILIGLLKGPYFYSPLTHLDRLKDRAKVVFEKLKELKLFPEGAKPWNDKKWESWQGELKKRDEDVLLRSLFYLTRSNYEKSFKTYILVKEVEKLKNELREKYPKKDLAIKTLLLKVTDEDISKSFEYYTKYERSWDKALNKETHQVGSTLKPILYWLLSKEGLSLEDLVETAPFTLQLKSGPWSPREAHKEEREKITYREALVHSFNRPVIRSVQNYGFDKMEAKLKTLIPQLLTPLSEYPAQLLGSVEMSLDELANLYATFLRSACYEGKGSEVVDALSDPTETTIRYRVGKNLGQMRFFGKTGTTNNGNDNWFIGYDGKELLVTWVGLEAGRDKKEKLQLYGSNSAFLVFRDYFLNRGKLFNEMVCRGKDESNL